MGNTCKPMAVSFQWMTKSTTNKKKKKRNLLLVPYPEYFMVKWKKKDALSLCEARWRTEDWVNLHERRNTLKSFGKRHNPLSIIPGWFLWLPTHPSWTYMHVNHSLWRKHDPASYKWTSFYELKAWIPKKPLDLKRLKKKLRFLKKQNPWTIESMEFSRPDRILEWIAFPFCRESSQPRDQT